MVPFSFGGIMLTESLVKAALIELYGLSVLNGMTFETQISSQICRVVQWASCPRVPDEILMQIGTGAIAREAGIDARNARVVYGVAPHEKTCTIERYRPPLAHQKELTRLFDRRLSAQPRDQAQSTQKFSTTLPSVADEFIQNHLDEYLVDNEFPYTCHHGNLRYINRQSADFNAVLLDWCNTHPILSRKKLRAVSGHFMYPKETGFMGWHTNSNARGYRMYAAFTEKDGGSMFKYVSPFTGKIVTDYDERGWTFRLFRIDTIHPLWHCVDSFGCDRYSVGLKFEL